MWKAGKTGASVISILAMFCTTTAAREPTIVVVDEGSDIFKAKKEYQSVMEFLDRIKTNPNLDCEGKECTRLDGKAIRFLEPLNPDNVNIRPTPEDESRILDGSMPIPDGWRIVETTSRLYIGFVFKPPWEMLHIGLPDLMIEIAGSSRGYDDSDTIATWVPSDTIKNGRNYLQQLLEWERQTGTQPCSRILDNQYIEGNCRIVRLRPVKGSESIGVCRVHPSFPSAISGACAEIALVDNDQFMLRAEVYRYVPTSFVAPCCGGTFYKDFPCYLGSSQEAIQKIRTVLSQPPLSLSVTIAGTVLRGLASWRSSPFLKGTWREQFAFDIQIGEEVIELPPPPDSLEPTTFTKNASGYIAEINYVLKNGATPETEEMHLPNDAQKKFVYDEILNALENGLRRLACTGQPLQ